MVRAGTPGLCDGCGKDDVLLHPKWIDLCYDCVPREDYVPPDTQRVNLTQDMRAYQRNYYLKGHYNLTLVQYNKLTTEQHGLCAICGNPETIRSRNGNIRELAVDCVIHEDGSMVVDGLLCARCKTVLTHVDRNRDLLERSMHYLVDPPAHVLLYDAD